MSTDGGGLRGGIEAGGTKFVCAVGRGPIDLASRTVIPTTTPEQTLRRVVEFFEGQRSAGLAFDSLGVAAFGPLDLDPASPAYGHVTSTLKPGWAGVDLLGPVRDQLGAAVTLDTDVNGAAYGEYRWGASRGLRNSVYVTVGTGIGGGLVVDGRPVRGLLHPEMGHLHVVRHPDDTYPGYCPYHGDCLEGLASGTALLARTGRPPGDLGPDRPALLGIEAWYLAQLISALVYLASPQRIVLGGGVMRLPGLIEAVRARTVALVGRALTTPALAEGIDDYLVGPALGELSGVLGALALPDLVASGAERIESFSGASHDP